MIVCIILPLLFINIVRTNRLLIEEPDLSPEATNCTALSCLEGYSCCEEGSGGVYCCIPSELTDICSLSKVIGRCRASIPRYYYDSTEQICKLFRYGGCDGNENNFKSLNECNKHCAETTSSTDDHCSAPADHGPCPFRMPRFYYDSNTQKCKLFMYGGCKGNNNKFKSKRQCIHECDTPLDTFDWESALDELETHKALWQSNGILKYVYHSETFCFCRGCDVAGKYIQVKEDVATKVQFDEDAPTYCNESAVQYPIDENYMDINALYDKAIEHVMKGMDADCPDKVDENEFPDAICGGGVVVTYDDVLNYPMYISLQYGPFIADIEISYTMDCLTVIDIIEENQDLLDEYENECISTTDIVCSDSLGDVCDSEEECCDGSCGISRLDNTVNVCCYHDKSKDISCENDGECCDGYECDGGSKLCVEI